MIEPKSNKLIHGFFSWYISHIIRSDFERFVFNKENFDQSRSILLLSNHFSWWDGFIIFHLNKIYFKKKFHVMVLEETLKEVKFLPYMGCFSIQKNAKSLIQSLDYAAKLLDDPKNLVLIFPQGELHSSHVSSVAFEKGVGKIIASSQKKFQYVFAAILTDYFNFRKPSINIFLKLWQAQEFTSLQVIKSEYNKHYEKALKQQSEIKV
ncbi:lysophospholipid acyltransferase family protein [Pedobacter sp. SD-b]|uniref:Lysophospholipid acyltransferase family protein n=1 Tax=Pedobacter segetis TaxID=2793069 RepID=A0ABS1BLH7_9SPHI|nr:lysophospholipid acyltransferase family protein [Pedobacter segetis]MBK0383745.1 lysophospholipid acyltransferase family protein [Pedobacter segetis]